MASAKIECTECQAIIAELPALSRSELCGLVESMLVASHAARAHCSHALRLRVTGFVGNEHELSIRCLQCKTSPPLVASIPIELVGALTLVFHTAHEGHGIELSYAGRSWSSPSR